MAFAAMFAGDDGLVWFSAAELLDPFGKLLVGDLGHQHLRRADGLAGRGGMSILTIAVPIITLAESARSYQDGLGV